METREKVIALVLAAGRGKRFGRDKRLEPLDGNRTLLQATLASVTAAFGSVALVIRDDDSPERLGIKDPAVQIIRSTHADNGLGYSLADGIAALKADDAEACAVLLGDMPCIEPQTFAALREHVRDDRIVRPDYHGRGGHPVIFGRRFWDEVSRLASEDGARSILHQHPEACIHIEVDDPGILMDADRPEALEALRAYLTRGK